jgi:mannonate dehydratase
LALLTRRRVLLGAAGLGGLAVGARWLTPRLLRTGDPRPLDGEARAFVQRCFDGIDRTLMWDSHAHLVGLGSGGTGCAVSSQLRRPLRHPIKDLQFAVYMAASGVTGEARADQQYLQRLLALHHLANPDGKLLLLAFDRYVGEDGVEQPDRADIYTPDDYVLRVAHDHPEVRACASVHPYRADAPERLQRAHDAGALAVKWLPNAMGIDPASPRCDRLYRKMAELGMPLITHTGREQAVDARDAQALGNPLRLRRALDAGVLVVAAHFASLGDDQDIDRGGGGARVPSFDLLMRLFGEGAYARTLFADISALTQVNRCGRPLRTLLASPDLHGRLINGSDYPLPAIDPVFSTRKLVREGYLTPEERRLCNQVFAANPLLFDFVVKRTVKVQAADGKTHRFAPSVFESARLLDPARRRAAG